MVRPRAPVLAFCAAAALGGCGGAGAARSGARPATGGSTAGQLVAAAPVAPVCVPEARPATPWDSERGAAIDALLSGRYRDAAAAFEAVVRKHPRELASLYLHNAAAAGAARGSAEARKSLRAPLPVGPIPTEHEVRTPLALSAPTLPALRKVSEQKNLIVDDGDWLQKNGLEAPESRPAAAETPEVVPRTIDGERLGAVISFPDHHIGIYGATVGVFAPGKQPRLYDFGRIAGRLGIAVGHARAVGSALLVQLARNGYTAEAKGGTGYLVAISLDDGRVLWGSGPRVANAANFAVVGGSVITAFGFSAEPDHLFVLDAATGRTQQKLPLRKAASWIIPKGDKLFVRTYDTDYELALGGPAAPAPAAELGPDTGETRRGADAQVRCWVDAAVAGIAAREPARVRAALDALDAHRADEPLVTGIAAAAQFLEQRQGPNWRGVDLARGEELIIVAPPWEYSRNVPAAAPDRPPRLVQRAAAPPSPERHKRLAAQARTVRLAMRPDLPPGLDPPGAYGFEPLRAAFRAGDGYLLVYGGRWVVLVDSRGDAVRAYDLDQLRHPPRANPQWKQFAEQDVTGVALVGDVLYVANGGGSYAKEVFGKKGFMTALDARTGKLLWRSQPLVAGGTFVVHGDYLITGYGFTDEPDHLFLLRRADGSVAQRLVLPTAPHDIYIDGGLVRVDAYGGAYDFDLVP